MREGFLSDKSMGKKRYATRRDARQAIRKSIRTIDQLGEHLTLAGVLSREHVELFSDARDGLLYALAVEMGTEEACAFCFEDLEHPIQVLDLSARATRILLEENIDKIVELVRLSANDLSSFKDCGTLTIHEIRRALGKIGLALRGEIALSHSG
jgi:DNA-directed RNA polymerase alpha subunit